MEEIKEEAGCVRNNISNFIFAFLNYEMKIFEKWKINEFKDDRNESINIRSLHQ